MVVEELRALVEDALDEAKWDVLLERKKDGLVVAVRKARKEITSAQRVTKVKGQALQSHIVAMQDAIRLRIHSEGSGIGRDHRHRYLNEKQMIGLKELGAICGRCLIHLTK